MITVLRTALFREIKVCLIGRNGRACSQSFYQENILIIKTFCPFVLLSIIIICSYVLLSKIQLSGRSTGYVREMFEQHLPLLKPFTHRCFTHFTGNVAQFCEIHDKYVEPHKILLHSLGTFETILYLCNMMT